MNMNDDFSVLAQFLESLGPEVSGHSSAPLTADQVSQIERFAEGNLSAEGRESLLPEILGNEKALHELVKRLQSQQ
tara:strand:+ start:4242 stop:4469 length:228 start_codon:yes stop_codon:yes gene_type:complete